MTARAALLDEAEGVVDYLREQQAGLDLAAGTWGYTPSRLIGPQVNAQAADLIERLAQELHGQPY